MKSFKEYTGIETPPVSLEESVKPDGVSVKMGSTQYNLEVADTPNKIIEGLSYRENIPQKTGMLFVMPKEQIHEFWMKDCLTDMDIIFLTTEGQIVNMENMIKERHKVSFETNESYQSRLKMYSSKYPAKYAIEIPSGDISRLGLEVGQYININNEITEQGDINWGDAAADAAFNFLPDGIQGIINATRGKSVLPSSVKRSAGIRSTNILPKVLGKAIVPIGVALDALDIGKHLHNLGGAERISGKDDTIIPDPLQSLRPPGTEPGINLSNAVAGWKSLDPNKPDPVESEMRQRERSTTRGNSRDATDYRKRVNDSDGEYARSPDGRAHRKRIISGSYEERSEAETKLKSIEAENQRKSKARQDKIARDRDELINNDITNWRP